MKDFGLQYVLDNLIAARPCNDCGAVWLKFNHEKNQIGIYRLGESDPKQCTTCEALDAQLERGALLTAERWISREEVGI